MTDLAPVALFAFNRLDHLRQTIEALGANTLAGETELFVFSDGPRASGGVEEIAGVRALLGESGWKGAFARAEVVERAENMGLAASIIDGVGSLMEEHGKVIVLEDDLLAAPDFLAFMNGCLDHFADDRRVGQIAGYSPIERVPEGYRHDIYRLRRTTSHGWASWRDRWEVVDWGARGIARLLDDPVMLHRFDEPGGDRFNRLLRALENGRSSWSVRFGLSQLLAGQWTIYPVRNRIAHIGTDGSGTNRAAGEMPGEILSKPEDFRLEFPPEDARFAAAFDRIFGGTLKTRFAKRLRALGLAKYMVPASLRKGRT